MNVEFSCTGATASRALHTLGHMLWYEGKKVDTGHWQSVKDVPHTKTIELTNVHAVFESMPSTVEGLQKYFEPNLPWAEDQFLERVSGIPHNPPPSANYWFSEGTSDPHRTVTEPEVDECDWAYLAALIDADGSITFPKAEGKIHPRIRVSWVTKEELRGIALQFGVGSVCERQHTKNYADQLIWQIQAVNEVRWVLTHITPYLRLKKAKAERALSLCDYVGRVELPKSEAKFSHTYPERFWPPRGHGIRYRYGDLNDLVELLAREPYTRQAYLPVWFPEDTGAHHRERVPCTLGYHFMLRESKLNIFYPMRSCDFLRYMRDDCYLAARLGLWIIEKLQHLNDAVEEGAELNPWQRGVQLGHLNFFASSLHVFEGDLPKMRREYA